MDVSNVWEYLDNIWVLAGLVLVVFTGLLKLLPLERLPSPTIEKLVHKGINYLFILSLVSIVLGFVTFQSDRQAPVTKNQAPIADEITLTIDNNTGTTVNDGESVNINQPPPPTQDRKHPDSSNIVNQQIKNTNGIAIIGGRDVSANIQEE